MISYALVTFYSKEQIITKKFNETVELEPCVDNIPSEIKTNRNDIKWLYDSNYIGDLESNVIFNVKNF
jgi:hypothetical protein